MSISYIGTPPVFPINLRHPHNFESTTFQRGTLYVDTHLICLAHSFTIYSLAAAGLFSHVPLRGAHGGHRHITTYAWVPAELCGASSGRSTLARLARFEGIASRLAESRRNIESYNFTFVFLKNAPLP